MVILVISNIMAWWQLNGQFYFKEGHPFWKNPYWMSLYGIPIGFKHQIELEKMAERFNILVPWK